MFIWTKCLCSSKQICWFLNENLKTVDYNCHLVAKGVFKAHWHCFAKILSLRPVNKPTQPVVHGIHPWKKIGETVGTDTKKR